MENGIATINKEKIKVKKPSLYKVIMHNDDFTTMEFVEIGRASCRERV